MKVFTCADTHALSGPAEATVLQVLAANGVEVVMSHGGAPVPTPVISHAILLHNRGRNRALADGLVLTPSPNPPQDGGIKYNPPEGGPADTGKTGAIEERANALLAAGLREVRRLPLRQAKAAACVREVDLVQPYVADLASALDFEAIAARA